MPSPLALIVRLIFIYNKRIFLSLMFHIELITILNQINEVLDTLHGIKEIMIVIMIMRFLLCVIM